MRTPRARVTAAAISIAALAAFATACGSDDSDSSPAAGEQQEEGQQETAEEGQQETEEGQQEPEETEGVAVPGELDFTVRTVAGGEFEGASLAGQDAVLWFWAPWCTICAGEASSIRDAAETHGAEVTFLGVPGLGETSDMETFVADHQLEDFPHAVDADGSLWSGFGVAAQPAIAFVDDTGEIEVVPGSMSEGDLSARIDALIAS